MSSAVLLQLSLMVWFASYIHPVLVEAQEKRHLNGEESRFCFVSSCAVRL